MSDAAAAFDTGAASGAGAADLLGGAATSALAAGGAGGGAGGAGAGAAGGAADGGAGSGLDPDWYGSLSVEADGEAASNRDWVKAKGFKDLDSMAKSLRHAEKAISDSGRVKIPGEGATPEERAAFNKAIGVPEDAKGYAIAVPKDAAGNDMAVDNALIDVVTASGVKHGASKAVLEGIMADVMTADLDRINAHHAELDRQAAEWVSKQGAASAAKTNAVNAAIDGLGLSKDEVTALRGTWGPGRAMDVLSRLGEGMAEDVMLTGGKGRFGVSGAEAKAELATLTKDTEWGKKAMVFGSPENQRLKRLQAAISDEAVRKAQQG